MNGYDLNQLIETTDWEEERYQDATYARAQQQLREAVTALLELGETTDGLHRLVSTACDEHWRETGR